MKKLQTLIFIYFTLTSFPTYALKSAPWIGVDLAGLPCQGKGQGYGPYDYINFQHRKKMPIVESHHFTADVENLIKGKSGYLTSDLDYTLRAIPNHHRALLSIIRYQLKVNSKLLISSRTLVSPVECYLQRAMNFSPKDAGTISLYAYYLKKLKKLEESKKLFQKALSISPDNQKIVYSYSLLLIELKQYDEALKYAKKVYVNGNPPKKLREKLIKIGKWKD